MNAKHVLVLAITAIIIFGAICIGGLRIEDADINQFKLFDIIDARLDSPAIIISVDSEAELVEKATKMNATTIYDTDQGYIIIDVANDIGYLLTKELTWFGLAPFWSTIFMVSCGIATVAFSILVNKDT